MEQVVKVKELPKYLGDNIIKQLNRKKASDP